MLKKLVYNARSSRGLGMSPKGEILLPVRENRSAERAVPTLILEEDKNGNYYLPS